MSRSALTAALQLREQRKNEAIQPLLTLLELDPRIVIEGTRIDNYLQSENLATFGDMRETCPECNDVHLQLILRQEQVRLAHLFCPQCTRCYDARYPDGSCALTLI